MRVDGEDFIIDVNYAETNLLVSSTFQYVELGSLETKSQLSLHRGTINVDKIIGVIGKGSTRIALLCEVDGVSLQSEKITKKQAIVLANYRVKKNENHRSDAIEYSLNQSAYMEKLAEAGVSPHYLGFAAQLLPSGREYAPVLENVGTFDSYDRSFYITDQGELTLQPSQAVQLYLELVRVYKIAIAVADANGFWIGDHSFRITPNSDNAFTCHIIDVGFVRKENAPDLGQPDPEKDSLRVFPKEYYSVLQNEIQARSS